MDSNRGEIGGGGGGSNLHGYAQEGGLHAPPPVSNPNNIAEAVMEKKKKKRGRPRKYGGAEKSRRGRPRGTGWRQKLAARLGIINPGAEKPRRGRGRPLGSTKQKMADRRLHMSTMECESPGFSPEPNMSGENCRKRTRRRCYEIGPSGSHPCAPPPLPQPHHSAAEEYVIVESDDDDIECYGPLPPNRTATVDKRSRAHEIGDERSGEVEHIIDAIKAKHGDIVEDCIMKSGQVREMSLVCICNVLKYLQEKSLEELEVDSLEHYYEAVRDLEKLNINVKWLLERLDEIKDAITSRDEAKILGDEKRERVKKLEEERREVERLANENRIFEERVEWLNKSIINGTSKFEKYQNMPDLMDGLI